MTLVVAETPIMITANSPFVIFGICSLSSNRHNLGENGIVDSSHLLKIKPVYDFMLCKVKTQN